MFIIDVYIRVKPDKPKVLLEGKESGIHSRIR